MATSIKPRSQRTSIDASAAEFAAYDIAKARGEIGLQRPGHVSESGPDFITAARRPDGQMEIIITDATINPTKVPKTTIPTKWESEVKAAVDRVKLPDPKLEAEIKEAYQQGRKRIRTQDVVISERGSVTVTDR